MSLLGAKVLKSILGPRARDVRLEIVAVVVYGLWRSVHLFFTSGSKYECKCAYML
jgi:hypothetical protein